MVPAAPPAPRRTAPVGVALSAISGLRKSIAGLAAIIFVMRDETTLLWIAIAAVLALLIVNVVMAVLKWRRLTFTVGTDELRVESGVLSRASRSVPYARIHDINLEQGLLARAFGLVKVTFDTGAGGEEDVSLAFLRSQDGEDLRGLVRARKDVGVGIGHTDGPAPESAEERSSVLFAMSPRRVVGALVAVASLLIVGFATGVARTVLREWGFLLERTERGFRRRRGLLTRTDVVMPVHRVQAMRLRTGILRRRFGWHALTFLSLAQDAAAKSHVVAPFGQLDELWLIARAADFDAPDRATDWQRASLRYRRDGMLMAGVLSLVGSAIALALGEPLLAMVPPGVGVALAAERWLAWRHTEHTVDRRQILSRRGWLAPRLAIAPRAKLQSIEYRQGPLGRLHGYGTVRLGVAGGTMSIPGVSEADLTVMRRAILESIAAIDFCQLDRGPPAASLVSFEEATSPQFA